jgi:excisionase family DNA binding protein
MQALINEGKVRSLKIGALRRIPAEALGEYIERESRG